VRQAAREHGLDPEQSFFIGDKGADIACGQGVGMRTVLVETGLPEERPDPESARPDTVARDLSAAVEWILQQGGRQP
jgi:phosphoglycolate phosphatase-like HAD superfamily hydrolase